MRGKRLWVGLAVLILLGGCAGTQTLKKEEKKPSRKLTKKKKPKKAIKYDNKKYEDKLILTKDSIDFVHSFDCLGVVYNRLKNRIEDRGGRLLSYSQVVKCSVTGETHNLHYYGIAYNAKGKKVVYKLDMNCSKTGENYRLIVQDLRYDFYGELLGYTVTIGKDKLIFPVPKKK